MEDIPVIDDQKMGMGSYSYRSLCTTKWYEGVYALLVAYTI